VEEWHVSFEQKPCVRCGAVVETAFLWCAWWLEGPNVGWAGNKYCTTCWTALYVVHKQEADAAAETLAPVKWPTNPGGHRRKRIRLVSKVRSA
jgi:hypothetical protein